MSGPRIVVWEFRSNHDHFEDSEVMISFLHRIAKKFVFQLEKGEETGYVHWQGRMSLWKPKRKPELVKLMKGMDMPVPNYLQPTTDKEHANVAFYVMKEQTRVSGPWSNKDRAQYVPRQYRNKFLYPYQQKILDSRLAFDERGVDCIIDTSGCNGKSTIASIADLMHGAIDMPPVNDGERLIASLCDILIAKECRAPGVVFFDLPRSLRQDRLHSLYVAIEQIKKGKVWDMRHSYKEWWFDSPRIWVFTNTLPDLAMLTRDRWRFWKIVGTDDDRDLELMQPWEMAESRKRKREEGAALE